MYGFSFKRVVVQPMLAAALLAAWVPGTWAQPPAAAHHQERLPQASLQAQAVTQVAHDRVRITLAHEVSGKSQSAVAASLGKAAETALGKARGNQEVKASSGSYSVWPMNDEQGRISNWRGRAEVILDSANFAAASELAGALGDTMAVAHMNFYLSPQARADHEAKLLDQASGAFRDRAAALAKAFGYADYRIREVSLGGAGARYEAAPRMMAMAADKSVDVPLEPGTEQVSVAISGSVYLLSAKE